MQGNGGMPALSFARIVTDGDSPSARGGHSAAMAEDQVIIFGGSRYTSGGRFAYFNDTFTLDTEHHLWHKVACSGEAPTPRYGHSAELIGSRMFVFGGRGEVGTLRDMYFLDLVEWSWVPLSVTSACPSPRFFHASLLVGRKVVVHGGWDGHMQCMGDLWVFNSDTFTWVQPRCAGIQPSPRYGHSLSLLTDGRILCFGGCTVSSIFPVPQYHNDLRQLDTETMIWTKSTIQGGEPPSKRHGHTTTKVGDGLIVFGGWGSGGLQNRACNQEGSGSFRLLESSPGTSIERWTVPQTYQEIAHKYGHTMSAVGTRLYIIGGWNGKQATSDIYQIHLE